MMHITPITIHILVLIRTMSHRIWIIYHNIMVMWNPDVTKIFLIALSPLVYVRSFTCCLLIRYGHSRFYPYCLQLWHVALYISMFPCQLFFLALSSKSWILSVCKPIEGSHPNLIIHWISLVKRKTNRHVGFKCNLMVHLQSV